MSRPANQIAGQLAAARAAMQQYVSMQYTYSMLFNGVAGAGVTSGATATAQMQIQADSNFMITQLAFVMIDVSTGQGITSTPGAVVQLTDTGSGMTLFDRPLPVYGMFGTGQLPFILPVERVLSANSVLSGTLTAGTFDNATNVYLLFQGAKIFSNG